MTLAIDASTPATKGGTGSITSLASNTFSPPGGASCIIVVACTASGIDTSAQSVSAMTDSLGSHLSWTRLVRSNVNTNIAGTLGGTTEFWYAACPSAQTNMTVTMTLTIGSDGTATHVSCTILPIVWTGAATTQAGVTNTKSDSTSGASVPSQSVAGTTSGSWIIAVIENYLNGTGPTVPGGQTTTVNGNSTQQLNTTDGVGFWTQIQSTTSAGGTITINDTAPTVNYNMAVLEVQAASGAAATPAPNIPPWPQAMWRSAYRMQANKCGRRRPKLWIPPKPVFGGVYL